MPYCKLCKEYFRNEWLGRGTKAIMGIGLRLYNVDSGLLLCQELLSTDERALFS